MAAPWPVSAPSQEPSFTWGDGARRGAWGDPRAPLPGTWLWTQVLSRWPERGECTLAAWGEWRGQSPSPADLAPVQSAPSLGQVGKGRASGGPPGRKTERKCSSTFPPGPESSVLKPHVQGGGWCAHGSPKSGNSTERTWMRLREPGGGERRRTAGRTKSWHRVPRRQPLCQVQSSRPRSPRAGPAGRLPAVPGTHREPSCAAGSCYLCTMSLISFTELRSLLKS